jgi:D-alanine-D-alanine ligase
MDQIESNDLVSIQEQEPQESDKPPSTRPRPARPWRVAVVANVRGKSTPTDHQAGDAGAEFDKPETIKAVQAAIESDGHTTIFLEANSTLPGELQRTCPDICFNFSEGLGGDAREAQVPSLLEMLQIPYTASRVLANAIGLDKAMTKRVWRDLGLPTAPFQEFNRSDEPISPELSYPLFVKPAREGTGMGMDNHSICNNETELRQRVAWVLQNYRQPALVESYLPGREFTVAVLGRPEAARYSRKSEQYSPDGFLRLPVLEVDNHGTLTPGVYGYKTKTLHFGDEGIPGFLCPAPITEELSTHLQNLAIKAHKAIGALDVSRVDIRMDASGEPRLMEINTLPGISPGFSDLCVIANAFGWSYEDLVLEILYLGASRFGLLPVVEGFYKSYSFEAIPALEYSSMGS